MEIFDVAIIGGGPAGSSCAAFCAFAGLERCSRAGKISARKSVRRLFEPSSWPVLERLSLAQQFAICRIPN
jgi:flavin-dependent dehydrogenase